MDDLTGYTFHCVNGEVIHVIGPAQHPGYHLVEVWKSDGVSFYKTYRVSAQLRRRKQLDA